jgi:hypothetical protein
MFPLMRHYEYNIERTLECRKQGKGGTVNDSDLVPSLRGDSLEKLQGSRPYRKEHLMTRTMITQFHVAS